MDKLFSWLARCFGFGRHPLVVEHEQAMRRAWTSTANQLGLTYTKGSHLWDDEITGSLDGFRIAISNESNFDVQKLVTLIRVFSDGVLPASKTLDPKQLLAAYDESVKTGVVPEGSLSDDAREWFLGRRLGVGTEVVDGDLRYMQLFGMDRAADIIVVAKAMVLTIRQLAHHQHLTAPS